MPHIEKSIEINAPVSEVFSFMADPEHLLEIWPSMVEVKNVKQTSDGGHSYDWVYKMAGMRFNGHSETTEVQPNRLAVVKNEKGIPSTFRWSYRGQDDTTEIKVEVDYELPGAILGKVAEPFLRRMNEREAENLLFNLKARLEEGKLKGAQPESRPHV